MAENQKRYGKDLILKCGEEVMTYKLSFNLIFKMDLFLKPK